MGISVQVLQANHGDCILVTHESLNGVWNLLIDGGNAATFQFGQRGRYSGALRCVLDELKEKGQKIDLAILTHIDDDHIGGLLRAFETPGYLSEMVSSIWFNSSRFITDYFNVAEISDNDIHLRDDSPLTSVRQGKNLETLLNEISCARQPVVMASQKIIKGPFTFTILSPDEDKLRKLLHKWPDDPEPTTTSGHSTDYDLSLDDILADDIFENDPSDYNGSSIAFILEAEGKRMLFLGDAHDKIIVRSLRALGHSETRKLPLDFVKISHHGSQYNTSSEFLSLINTHRFIISTNGAMHGLPNKRTIARILASGSGNICFNYSEIISPLLHEHETETYSSRLVALDGKIRL
ncbi:MULTISPECIES: ComEC/Rec2 family competence protein [Yersiniaceae]|uniref:MBL fold metallo-hydrolase n=1 Tax=Rahnella ecdela TaxID=2816250 RepID=A0ABS6LCJ7_9GAMM|nr:MULTISPECIES: MBL fold metallo-hydrolase [Yersiniaceae]MBU9844660.1 MBL fold metallo-hydrolase [Rahnella ecdela]MCL9643476.1 MBL fold metallo-hydrolase [Rahnella victoriana]CNJ39088.1 metallo-beta-lactamase family protein [Yersinia mollaretii]